MSIDASDVLARTFPKLNAASSGDLVFWTTDELYLRMEEAQQRISRLGIRASKTDIAGVTQVVTALPAGHATTVAVFWNNVLLRPSSVAILESLDDSWQTTTGTPSRWIEDDDQGTKSIRIYPAPAASGTLTLIYFVIPLPVISASNTTTPLNRALDSYLLLRTVEAARMKESKGGMPEVAQAIGPVAAQFEQAAIRLWK